MVVVGGSLASTYTSLIRARVKLLPNYLQHGVSACRVIAVVLMSFLCFPMLFLCRMAMTGIFMTSGASMQRNLKHCRVQGIGFVTFRTEEQAQKAGPRHQCNCNLKTA